MKSLTPQDRNLFGITTPDAQNTVYRFSVSGTGIGGGARYWGRACREKGPAPATKYFSGNGIAVATMCAVRHQYRPVAANEGGLTGKVDISLEMDPVAHSWLTHGPTGPRLSMGGTGFEPVTSWV